MKISKRMVSGDLDLLKFLYPDYKVIYNLDNIDSNFIYAGKLSETDKLIEIMQDKQYDYIVYTRGNSEFDLRDRLILTDVVFEKYKRLVPRYLNEILNELDDETFLKNIKHYWVTGKWETKKVQNEDNFYTFISSINKSSIEMYKSYFNTLAQSNSYVLESSLMTFITRAKEGKTQDVNYRYRNKLNMFTGAKLRPAVKGLKESLSFNIDNHELKLLNEVVCIMRSK